MSRMNSVAIAFLLAVASCNSAALAEKRAEKTGVSANTKVMAPPDLTYQALRSLRDESPSTDCKVLSTSQGESVVEEVFGGLPIVGQTTCVYREVYEPGKRISFKMIHSDKMKAFEGEWTLEPIDNGEHTLVKLHSYTDMGLKLPFARQLTDLTNTSEIKAQLAELKKSAEQKQKKLAAGNKNQSL